MSPLDLVRRAGRSLRSAKGRTILTSLAIAVGAFTLTATLSAGNGIRAYTDRLISNNFDPAESIVGRDKEIENTGPADSSPKEYDDSVTSMSLGGGAGSLQLKQLSEADITELRSLPFVESVRPEYQINARYVTREGQKKYTLSVSAYNPGQRPELVTGTLPRQSMEPGTVLLPQEYIALLGLPSAEQAIGQTVTIRTAKPFDQEVVMQQIISAAMSGQEPTVSEADDSQDTSYRIVGVTKKGVASLSPAGLPLMVSEADAKLLYDYTTIGTTQFQQYMYASVRVRGGGDASIAAEAKSKLKAKGYYVMTSQDIQKSIGQFVDILQMLVGVFGVITVIASIFGIINTMYISVLERTREIGLMKALGMRGRHVAWLFRIEAAWIGLLGGLIGTGLAVGLGIALNPWITKSLDLGKGNELLIFDWLQLLGLIIILTLVAIVAGWLPARKAARLDPIEALRTE